MARAAATIVAVVPTLVAGSHGPWVGVIVSTLPFAEPTKKRSNSGYEKCWRTGTPDHMPAGQDDVDELRHSATVTDSRPHGWKFHWPQSWASTSLTSTSIPPTTGPGFDAVATMRW